MNTQKKDRKYNKVTNMKAINSLRKIVSLNNVIYEINNGHLNSVRNNKKITKDGDVRNFSIIR